MSDGTPPGYDREEEKMAGNAGGNDDNDIYQSLDPLDPRKVSLEIFELYCHEMITAPIVGRRAYLITKMRYMVKRLIGHQYNYGRLYNRTCIANIVARVCARHPYPIDDNSDEEEDDGYNYRLSDCIVDWSSDKWEKIITQFESLRQGLLRNDAARLVLPAEFGDEDKEEEEEDDDEAPAQDDSVNPLLEMSKEFGENYTALLDLMKFHMCLSHIRSPQFEDMMKKGSDGDEKKAGSPVFISHDDTVALNNEIEAMFGDDSDNKYAVILNSLLESRSKKRSRSGRSGGLHLKSFDEIKKIHDNNAEVFDLGVFQTKFLKQIRRWSEMVLPIPELAKFGYGSMAPPPIPDNKENISSLGSAFATKSTAHQHPQNDPAESVDFDANLDDGDDESEEETEKKVDRLRRTRGKFMKNVKDPLPSIVEKAKSARSRTAQARQAATGSESTVSTPNFRKKKKSEHKITFTDSEEEEDAGDDKDDVDYNEEDEVEETGVTLSEVPKKFKQKVAASPKKIVVSTKTKSRGKRVKFSDSEDAAIRNGVERFGVGRWADIKAYYHIDLADRTSVQIKDRWRTLNK